MTRDVHHSQWSSSWGFILAASGAAVGLGNIWKFPYIAGQNGGGAFVLIYLACILFIGFPLLAAEVLLGRHGKENPEITMRNLAMNSNHSKYWGMVGGLTILAGFLILSYYSVIAGWALDYVMQACLLHFHNASASHINYLFEKLINNPYQLTLWHSIIMFSTVFVVSNGVNKGIERTVRYMFPTMMILMLIIILYSIDTGYFGHGWRFLFHPDFSKITSEGILAAVGHAFFTLSIATGSIMMYGAYVPKNMSIPKATFMIVLADTVIALMAGLAIFPIVFANNLTVSSGPSLIFKTLPLAFGHMPYGEFISVIFFIMLVFAAFSSAISLIEAAVSWLMYRTSLNRKKAAIMAGSVIWALGFITIFSFNIWSHIKVFNLNLFELLDVITANYMLPIGGLLIAIFSTWLIDKNILLEELGIKDGIWFKLWQFCLGVITPVSILIVFLNVSGLINLKALF